MNLEPNKTKQASRPISRASNFIKLILERISNYLKQCLRIEVFLMLIGGMMRHTAGFAWGYNQVIFFTYTKGASTGNASTGIVYTRFIFCFGGFVFVFGL